jgi:uncharacterized membrane protein
MRVVIALSPLMLLILVALLAGTCAAAAALYGHYRVLPGWLTGPEICQLEDGGCQVLFRTPRARLLGVPNAALGILLYVILAAGLIASAPIPLLWLLTWPAVAMSAFLGYGLIVNHRQCRICWTGHIANGVLFLALGYLVIR